MEQDQPWSIEYSQRAARALRSLDRTTAARILRAVERLATLPDPTASCKALTGPLKGLWRLRVGDWRVVLDIDHGRLVLVVLDTGHRSDIY